MNDFFWQIYHRLVQEVSTANYRFLYNELKLNHRLTGIVGPRGVGKTTLLLQYIKNYLYADGHVFYFSADNIYFNENTILDFVNELYLKHDIKYFFIDEIHIYKNWQQELKNVYDSFPDVKVVFSGSSSLDLIHGPYDLSRRAKLYYLPGLSFREYLNIKTRNNFESIQFEDLLKNHLKLSQELVNINGVLQHFEEYLLSGFYPIVFENKDTLYETLSNVIDKTVYEDIANYYNLKTNNLNYFKRILNFLASIPPGNINTNKMSNHLGIDNKTIENYLEILNRTSMIKILYPVAHGNQVLSKPAKVYLDNTTLLTTINLFLREELNRGTLRELALMQFINGAGIKAFYPEYGDFEINNIIFEVGGKNKTKQQLKAVKGDKYLIKDNILFGTHTEIPLYLFGFLY